MELCNFFETLNFTSFDKMPIITYCAAAARFKGFQILPKGKGQYWPLIKAAIGKAISAKPKAAKT